MSMLGFVLALVALQQPPPAPSVAAPLPPLPPQVGDTWPFRRLTLPTPNEMREGAGTPGPRYWQQRADYTIRATLDTATHTIAGSETLRYANNSPDTLHYLWLQLDQNIYKANSRGAFLNPTDARFAGRGFEGGYTIQYVRAVRRLGEASGRIPPATTDNGTMRRVDRDRPLAPGGGAEPALAYRFGVPEHGSDRMGREPFPAGCPLRHHGRHHHEGGGGAAVLSTRRPEAHAHLALHRQERARRGLGGRRQFHLGCERLRRDPDPVVLSARGEPRLGALDGVCAPLDQALLREMAPLPLPDRDQRGRSGGRDGGPDDRGLRAT